MLENARLEVKWFAMQMNFDIQLLHYLSAQDMFLFFLLMMMMVIFPPLCLYVGVMCEDCQMMRKTASVPTDPRAGTGRGRLSMTPR